MELKKKKTYIPLENIYFNIVGVKILFHEVKNLGKISNQIYSHLIIYFRKNISGV